YIGILLEIVEPQAAHGSLLGGFLERNCRRPSSEAAPAWLPLKPARRVCRLRWLCRSRTGRRRGGRDRSTEQAHGASGNAAAKCGRCRSVGPKCPEHDDLSSIHG